MEEGTIALVVGAAGGLGVPAVAASYFVIKAYIAKAKYHVKMESKIENLTKNDEGSKDIHEGHDDRLTTLEQKVQKLCDNVEETKGWIRLILKHLKIPFPTKKSSD